MRDLVRMRGQKALHALKAPVRLPDEDPLHDGFDQAPPQARASLECVGVDQHRVVRIGVAMLHVLDLPVLDRLGLLLFDSYQRAAPRAYADAPVKVVDIDDESIRRLGQWPWPRSEIARLTDRLGQAGASVVAFDVVFSEPDRTSPARIADQLARGGADAATLTMLRRLPDHDAELAQSFAATPVVLGYFLVKDHPGPQVVAKAGFAVGG